MPLLLNVGISKKIGLPDYGSLGTTRNQDEYFEAVRAFVEGLNWAD